MSLFTSFNAGVSGIRSAQAGLNTSSHNIANAKTKGYTRQQNINVDSTYQKYKTAMDGSKMLIGMGTQVSYIRQIRDVFLDKEYRLETGRHSFYEKLAETASEVEDIFGETEGVEFLNSMTKLRNIMYTLSTNPEDITSRQLFISTSESFLESAKNIYNSLQTYQVSLNTEIKSQVDKINELGEKIAAYNVLVAKAEASGQENANDYRDMRNLLMDELATYTNYTYSEDINGMVQIYVENAMFVSNGLSFHMGCELTSPANMYNVVWLDNGYGDVYDIGHFPEEPNQEDYTDAGGNLDEVAYRNAMNIYRRELDSREPYSREKKTDVGSLRGILTARGDRVANYGDIPVEPKQEDYLDAAGNPDVTAYKVAMNKFRDDLKIYNSTTGNSIITQIQAQFDQLIHGMVTAINDALAPNMDVTLAAVTGTDATGSAVTLAAGDYKILDVYNCPYGADDGETIGTEVFSRSQIDRYRVITLNQQIYRTDENGNQMLDEDGEPIGLAKDNGDGTYSLYVYNEEKMDDIDWMYTLRSMEINEELKANYSLLEIKANPDRGLTGAYAYGGALFEKMFSQWDEKFAVLDPNTLASYTYGEYYANMIGDLGTRGSVWNRVALNEEDLTASIEDKRQQVMGVSTEEEMVDLLKYQHAYNAASRYISVIDAMLEHLIERLG